MNNYEKIAKIGEGAFGKVYKCIERNQNIFVALKQIKSNSDGGISTTAIREIKIMKRLRFKHVLELKSVQVEENGISLILEYIPLDLAGIIRSGYVFDNRLLCSITSQIIEGLNYIHSQGFIHRDLKPANILVDNTGKIKIADFGLARESSYCMTNRVCTLWYRAPELLLGDIYYDEKIDMWSLGCIIVEMKTRKPIFKGVNEILQLKEIVSVLGSPSTKYPWNDLFDIDKFLSSKNVKTNITNILRLYFDNEMAFLIKELLQLDKSKRLSSKNALKIPIIYNNLGVFIEIGKILR